MSDPAGFVRANFARQGAMTLIGATIEQLLLDTCVVGAAYRPGLAQQHGFFHAGITGAVADSARGCAALTRFPAANWYATARQPCAPSCSKR